MEEGREIGRIPGNPGGIIVLRRIDKLGGELSDPADQLGLDGLGLVLVDLAAQGADGDVHENTSFLG